MGHSENKPLRLYNGSATCSIYVILYIYLHDQMISFGNYKFQRVNDRFVIIEQPFRFKLFMRITPPCIQETKPVLFSQTHHDRQQWDLLQFLSLLFKNSNQHWVRVQSSAFERELRKASTYARSTLFSIYHYRTYINEYNVVQQDQAPTLAEIASFRITLGYLHK